MQTLRHVLAEYRSKGIAIGHFNVADIVGIRAVFDAARGLNLPVMIGVSEGEREFIGVRQIVAFVKSLREEYDYPVFLNADHTHSIEKAVEAASAGFDEVLFDGSRLPFRDNVRQTRQAVELVHSINPNIVVEGEIGYIGSSSEVLEEVPVGVALAPGSITTAAEARQFVEETSVDVLAPAVGNMHGLLVSMVSGAVHKRVNIERVREISGAIHIPMTLHGGSGTADEDFVAAAKEGMAIIHVSTELRVAWRRGVEAGLAANPKEVAPYKILPSALAEVQRIVASRLALFAGCAN